MGHLVVVAPHPDDETLTVGGLVQRTVAGGGIVQIVAVTDGGHADPERIGHDELAAVRREEQGAAVEALGVSASAIIRLGVTDGSVADHERDVVAALDGLLEPGSLVVAPWRHDVHPDHEAVGRCALMAARHAGCASWSSVFWAWHHPATVIDADRLVRVPLSAAERRGKARAIAAHRSQLDHPSGGRPVLTVDELAPSRWDSEYFLRDDPDQRKP